MSDEESTAIPCETQRSTATLYTGPTADDLARIPAELHALPQWVLWRGEDRIDKQTGEVKLNKIPVDPQTLGNADTTDARTWGSFDHCVQALPVVLEGWEDTNPDGYRGGGIGFVFTEGDPFCGIDLDKCRDPETGALDAWAKEHVTHLDSYAEVTPSGTGLHVLVEGSLPASGRKKGHVECYVQMRFFTMTGWHLPGTPLTIEPRQDALTAFHRRIFGTKQATQPPSHEPGALPVLDDATLLDRAMQAKNGAKFAALWAGDWRGYSSQNEADMALCCLLAFWSRGHTVQMDSLFRQSGLMRDKWNEQRGHATYGQRTMQETLARQTTYHTPRKSEKPVLQPGTLPYGDTYNAKRLVERYGSDLRYCGPWHKWLVWSETHWQQDDTGKLMRRGKETVLSLMELVQNLPTIAEQQMLLAHIKSSLSTVKLKAMIESAQSELPLPILPEQLDRDHWLLNCLSGTIDLRTGTLQPHRREDLLTRCIAVEYDPQAICPIWDAFLWRIMGGTDAGTDRADDSALALEARHKADERARRLIDFLQRAMGYSLTSDTREQCLLVLHGSGSNGKSTFLETLQALLGDYGQSTPSATLLVKDRHEGIPNDIARLRGARLVTAVEIGDGKRLDEELVKRLTGQDTMTGRFLHAEFFDFKPEFKLWLACNHLPQIRGTDHAIWRRVKRIPFNVVIPDEKQDKTLPGQLRAELPGILQWAIRGCLAWQRVGLMVPEEVKDATQDYRASMDVIGRFIAEECITKPYAKVKASLLYDNYKTWCAANGEQYAPQRTFGMSLTEREFLRKPEGTGIYWHGIGLPAKATETGTVKSIVK